MASHDVVRYCEWLRNPFRTTVQKPWNDDDSNVNHQQTMASIMVSHLRNPGVSELIPL